MNDRPQKEETFVDVNADGGVELKPKKKKESFESYGIEYKKTMVCKHCHEEVEVGAEVCPHCKHFVDTGKKPYTPISEKKAWQIKFVLGIIIIAIFLVMVATK